MRALSKENDDFKYAVMVIDVFSKYGWAVPIKYKTGDEVKSALESILKKKTPRNIWSDECPYNAKVNIELNFMANKEKCSVIERWNCTIKGQQLKYFTTKLTYTQTL